MESLAKWSVDEVEEIGTKDAGALVAIEQLEDSDWTLDTFDELGRKAAETEATLKELEQASPSV